MTDRAASYSAARRELGQLAAHRRDVQAHLDRLPGDAPTAPELRRTLANLDAYRSTLLGRQRASRPSRVDRLRAQLRFVRRLTRDLADVLGRSPDPVDPHAARVVARLHQYVAALAAAEEEADEA